MTAETSNLILAVVAVVGVILAVVGAIGNVIAFLFARIELRGQRNETRELQKLTSELQQQLYRLNTELDQNIQRLYRARDAAIGYQKAATAVILWTQQFKNHGLEIDLDKLIENNVDLLARIAELKGLFQASGDNRLKNLIGQIPGPQRMADGEVLMDVTTVVEIMAFTGDVHALISELLTEATKESR